MSAKKNGFSIVEVLIAAGLMSIIGVGISSFLTKSMKSQKGIQAKGQQRELTNEIRNLLSDKIACENSFKGMNPKQSPIPPETTPGFDLQEIKDAAGNVKYGVGSSDKSGLLEVRQIRVSDWDPDVSIPTQGNVVLRIKLSKKDEKTDVKDLLPDIINIKVQLDGTGKIGGCFSFGKETVGFWLPAVDTKSIYFAGGNVGIGTSTPRVDLEVAWRNSRLCCHLRDRLYIES